MAKKEPKNIVITNTCACLIEVAAPAGSKWNGRLLPGENDVPDDAWAHVRTNKVVKMYVEKGYLKNSGEGEAVPLTSGLDSLPFDEAKKQIAKCTSLDTLGQWKDNTPNSQLKRALEARMKDVRTLQNADNELGD